MNTLPVKIEPGQELEVQLCPHGQYEAMLSDRGKKPEPVVQDCSPDVLAAIAAAFIPEVLVDTDHESERPDGSTEAYAWITEVRHDPDAGLMGTFRFTDLGAGAVSARRFRFVSPSFEIVKGKGSTVVPVALLSCALTNRPNLPVRCVLNRAAPGTPPVEEPKAHTMTETAKLLGLPETATDAEIAAAVKSLQDKVAATEAAALNAEASAAADANKDRIANREEFVKLYVQNRDVATRMLAALAKPAASAARVTNSAQGARAVTRDGGGDLLATYNSMPAGTEKRAFLRANAQAIAAARAASTQD